jgi:hypothetical protein
MATLATVAVVAVEAFEIPALADTADLSVAAFSATIAAVAVVAVAVHALPVAARFVEAADSAAGAAIVAVGLQIIDALVVVAAPRPMTLQNAIDLCADARATVAAGAAVIRVEAQVVNAHPVATLTERGAADLAADLVAGGTGNALSVSADLVGGAGGPTGRAVVAAWLKIDALAAAAGFIGGALLQAPQCRSSTSRSKHLPPHSSRPFLHRQFPFWHLAPVQQSLSRSQFCPTFLQAAAALLPPNPRNAAAKALPSSRLSVPRRDMPTACVRESNRGASIEVPI